jgi:ankyrin repeat protein
MTIPLRKPASLTRMHLNPFRLAAACLILATAAARADEPPVRDLLRDGLYAEEVTRDREAAAKSYEQVLARYSEQRAFAASALFRLAEVRRKQDRKDDAIELYQRLLTEFPDANPETKIAMENLAALGGKAPEVSRPAGDAESVELARLESLAKDAPDIILDPKTLEQAVTNGWSKVVAHLLAAGSQPYAGDALRIAAEKGYLEIVRQLTAGEAHVPAQVATAGIQAAIKFNRHTILDFLLQRGFKPGEMSGKYDSFEGASALAYALLIGTSQYAETLLKYGADLDAISGDPDSSEKSGGTALQRVIAEGKLDAANWLLDKGAKPDIPSRGFSITPLHEAVLRSSDGSLALLQRLLEAGADPNRRIGDRLNFKGKSYWENATPLEVAVRSDFKSTEKIRLLLKHGADPKLDDQLIKLLLEQNQPDSMERLKLLVDAGARPDATWMKNNMERARGEAHFLVEKFTIPSFFNEAEIQLVINDPFGIKNSNIAVRSGDAAPPDLGAWLLANHQNSQWAHNDLEPLIYQWWIWRKGGDGTLTKQVMDFSGDAPIPPLLWGDIVECRITYPPGVRGASGRTGLPPQEVARLRRRIAFPITFEIDGMSREITVRGDRVIFDPTKNEVPLGNLQNVVWFLWQPGWYRSSGPIIHLTRKGWPDVRLSHGSKEVEKFQLQAGDRVRLEIPEQLRAELAAMRPETIILKVDGYPFAKSFGRTEGGKPVAASIPTLIQALVDTQVPWAPNWKNLAKSKNLDLADLSAEYGPFYQFSLLPHPDLANLRIRRLQDDGGEKVIDVNLAEIITASTDQTTPEEARKADVVLLAGDVVEVSLLKDRLGEPWKGFAAREETFFAKALSGRVRITAKDGSMTVRDLVFEAPRFQETEFGWVPLPPETGIPSMRGSWLTGDEFMETKRGTQESSQIRASEVFLRDGDAALLSETRSQRPQPPPRMVLPPSR